MVREGQGFTTRSESDAIQTVQFELRYVKTFGYVYPVLTTYLRFTKASNMIKDVGLLHIRMKDSLMNFTSSLKN